jgi:hypothetical protein
MNHLPVMICLLVSGHYATFAPFGLWLAENCALKLPAIRKLRKYLCDPDGWHRITDHKGNTKYLFI